MLGHISVFGIGIDDIDDIGDLNKYISDCRNNLINNENKNFADELLCDYYAFISAGELLCSMDENCNKAKIYTQLNEAIEMINTINHNLNVLSIHIKLLQSDAFQNKQDKIINDINEKHIFRFRYSNYSRCAVVTALEKRTGVRHFDQNYYHFSNPTIIRNLLGDCVKEILGEYTHYEIFQTKFLENARKARNFKLAF